MTWDDAPTIRWAILKRLDKEPGVKVLQTPIGLRADCITVGVLALIDDALITDSKFELPKQFSLIQVHNQIDEIAESFKAARLDHFGRGLRGQHQASPRNVLAGSGLRSGWPS